MSIFRRKSKPEDGEQIDPSQGEAITADPVKAQAFFDRARTVHDTTNYAYAMTLWLQGLRQDPTSVAALEKFVRSAAAFADENTKGPTKDQLRSFEGKSDELEKYLHALLQWGARGFDWEWGLKAMESATKLGLGESAFFVGERVLAAARQNQKAKKNAFVKLLDLFEEIGAFDQAVIAGDTAVQLDPKDTKLEHRVKNMSAQATMSRGGYEDTGAEGGFRRNIRNVQQQQELMDEESVVKSAGTLDALIQKYALQLQQNPGDPVAVSKYADFLLERGTAKDEKTAYQALMKCYELTNSYRFRQRAGDIKLTVGRRKLAALRRRVSEDPDDPERAEEAQKFQRGLLLEEIAEYEDRVKNYPTELKLKFELGRRLLEAGRAEEAIQQFQVAQNAPGIGGRVRQLLGQAFLTLNWYDEAEETFRNAISAHTSETDALGLDLRYGLLVVLQQKADRDRDLAAAEEAFRIASSIAIQQINFRDIRERRAQLEEMRRELKASA